MKGFLASAMLALVAMHAIGATFTVTNTNDAGAGSLRDAVTQANTSPGADTIVFDPAVTGTISLTSGQMNINDALTITGPGADKLTVDANGNSRVFSVFTTDPACPTLDGPDYLVSISGLRLYNAKRSTSNAGGAIFTEHSLALDGVVIENSTAAVGAGVAMLLQYGGQSLTVSKSRFLNNTAQPILAGTTFANGGAIYIAERCTGTSTQPVEISIANSLISGNRAQPTTGSSRGGGIAFFTDADIAITDTRIVGNGIEGPATAVAGQTYHGGGIYGRSKTLLIERSEIAQNYLTNAGTEQSRGAGMGFYNDVPTLQTADTAMKVRIVNSTISGNRNVTNTGAGWAYGNVALEFYNSTVASNIAAPTRAAGLSFTTGATNPLSASNARPPSLKLVSSILANNGPVGDPTNASDLGSDIANIPSLTVNSNNSLIRSICSTCGITVVGSGNKIGADPALGPLAFSAGPTRTHPPLPQSPAIDAGSNPLGLTTDQRGSGFPRVTGGIADMGAHEYEAGRCPGASPFPDVPSSAGYCAAVEWLKNRAVVTAAGCGGGNYCPTNFVQRSGMAQFMQRLGSRLSPEILFVEAQTGAIAVPLNPPYPLRCVTPDTPAMAYSRLAFAVASFTGLADASAIAYGSAVFYSDNNGVSWKETPAQLGKAASSGANQWSGVSFNYRIDLDPNLPYRFAIAFGRNDVPPPVTTGNFANGRCQLTVQIFSREGASSPFDATVRGDNED